MTRGYTLLECAAALALLALLATTSHAVLYQRRSQLARIDERLLALSVVEKELETARATSFAGLPTRQAGPALTRHPELAALEDPVLRVTISELEQGRLKQVRVELEWGGAERRGEAGEVLVGRIARRYAEGLYGR